MEIPLVNWPGVVRHAHDAELDYVEDQSAWEGAKTMLASGCDESDTLLDATGAVFAFVCDPRGEVRLQATGKIRTLQEVLGLVKAHAAQADSCCVAKLFAPSIVEAFRIVKATPVD